MLDVSDDQWRMPVISGVELLLAESGASADVPRSSVGVAASVESVGCSAEGETSDTAIFFGLSGTGKTTLSADPERKLIGDDEHGWDENEVFNFEGGCYAKTIDLCEEKEPEIYHAIRAGALVENVTFKKGSTEIDFCNRKITENTRVSYPLSFISNSLEPSIGGIPKNIFFLNQS